jgi:hypothetical protein
MQVQRSVHLMTVAAVCASLAACSSYGKEHARPDPNVVAVQWDSGPLDRDYQQQRSDMDSRHQSEIANPRADESSDQRTRRQTNENNDLDHRYAAGKAAHDSVVPPPGQH